MSGFTESLAKWLKDTTQRASNAISHGQEGLVRGKIAGSTVTADDGTVIVEAGHPIDDSVIALADAYGKLNAVTAAAGKGSWQDLSDKARTGLSSTEDGREQHALGSIEDYVAARRYVGKYIGMDITDIRGNIIFPAGTKLEDAHIRLAREQDLLGSIIYAAQQPWTAPEPEKKTETDTTAPDYVAPPTSSGKRSLSMVDLPEEFRKPVIRD